MNPLINTPVEEHEGILVKQEGQCAPEGWPAFSKIRGVVAHLKNRPEKVIGVLDTHHSKAGWAVAAACNALDKLCVNYWPRRKAEMGDPIKLQQLEAEAWGAVLQELQAGRSAILYHQAKKHLLEGFDDTYMMPNALKLPESVSETAKEVHRTDLTGVDTVAVSISSGTIAAGVVQGLSEVGFTGSIILHMGYSRSRKAVRNYIQKMSGVDASKIILIDECYNYSDMIKGVTAPFPCNPWYDLKLWVWLLANPFYGQVLFWNVGE